MLSDYGLRENDVLDALFGKEAYQPMGPGENIHVCRLLDGVWRGPQEAQYKKVSGVLITHDIRPWSLGARDLKLYHNPWANYTIKGPICKFKQARVDDKTKRIFRTDGIHPREIFGLEEGWPE